MRTRRHSFFRWLIAAALWAVGSARAETTVTLVNRTKADLFVARAGTGPAGALLVGVKDESGSSVAHRLPAQPGAQGPGDEAPSRELSGPDRPAAFPACILLRDGAAATFSFQDAGKDLRAELVLFRLDPQESMAFEGILVFSLTHRPAPPPDPGPEPEATLVPPGGPTPRTAVPACNRKLRQVSPREVWVMPGPERMAPESEAVASLPEFL